MIIKNKKVLVVGNFDIFHPGHIRLLKFAKECGDHLIVAVNADRKMKVDSHVDETIRLEMVNSLKCVDEAFISTHSPIELITSIQPWAVVKGKEFETEHNQEKEALDLYGGKLIFGSGEFEFTSDSLQRSHQKTGTNFEYSELKEFAKRRNITLSKVKTLFDKMQHIKVAVIGEVIVDEYVQGYAVGLSQEDPTIVMTPTKKDVFLGGAAITAGHIRRIGAKQVTLFSVLGDDEYAAYTCRKVNNYDIDSFLLNDESRPTPLKTRYRVDKKTLLRVNQLRHHKISLGLQDALFDGIEAKIKDLDMLVFSDFNYGVLPQALVERICALCHRYQVKIIADSQTSSQIGDISRYNNVFLMTPTEREARVALNNTDDGLVTLAKKLCDKCSPENLVITLANEGVFIHIPTTDNSSWENDKIPAINNNAADPAGAGDCFLATSSLCMAVGGTPWQAFYVASIAAACQVDTVGNSPLSHQLLLNAVEASFE